MFCCSCRGPPKPGTGPDGVPRGIAWADPWLARRPLGLWMPGIRDATGWWMGIDPALLWWGTLLW